MRRVSDRRKLYEILENHPDYPSNYAATDYGETIVSTKKLNMSISVNDKDGRTSTFVITKVAEILPEKLREYLEGRNPPYNPVGKKREYNPAPALQALQIILAKCPTNNQDILKVYRKGYFPTGGHPEWTETIGAGAVALKGFRFSVRPTVGGLLCNINVSGSKFCKEGPLTNFIAECLGMNDVKEIQHLTLSQLQSLKRYLFAIRVRILGGAVKVNQQDVVRITGIDTRTPNQVVFEQYDPLQGFSREMNLEEYIFSGIAPKSAYLYILNFVWFSIT
jgi:hypothetical protein